ncbi:glycoside hydrolase family 55 protein [Astrocystis sublimbata]|nr:glycoside hydrolase family 55 protein [Astrocystis sublimbata]
MGLFKILMAAAAVLQLATQGTAAASAGALHQRADSVGSQYWFSTIKRQGIAAYASEPDYKVFRNVRDYGAKGDGTTDDTDAINKAVTDGPGRCIDKCDSRTTHPAIVYFPSGTYLVKKPIVQTYYTQFVGDALNVPTIKGSSDFDGMGVIDANPYDYTKNQDPPPNWYINQNNFFRQIRNFIIDMTDMPTAYGKASAGIHWQVSQATSLQNIVFNMSPASPDNHQKGLFIENGSGGFMADLTFNEGGIGADFGSQQYTTRNLTFNNCNNAVHMIWNWLWLMQGVTINGGQVGINMTSDSLEEIKVGSLLLLDSKISNVPVGISTLYKPNQRDTNNTLILDNVDMSEGVPVAIQYAKDGSSLLEGNKVIEGWVQGKDYSTGKGEAIQTAQNKIDKPDGLLASDGKVFTRTKPQYESVSSSQFISVKSAGAMGDGKTDDTAAIQKVFDSAKDGEVVYFDHGAYLISDTVHVPKNIKITGEMWPLLMATGTKFTDEANPVAVFEVGKPGDVGTVEMSDLIIETKGALPGAILVQWNLAGSENGAAGMWDVHFRVGGTAGTELQSDHCSKDPNATTTVDDKCKGTFLMLHLTQTASAYVENCWFWVADHELDRDDHNQINIWNGRGVLIESQKPVWLWGTASEHSVLYNYQISNARNTFIGLAQSETAYMQGNPDATQGVTVMEGYFDPQFKETCNGSSDKCARTWGMRITNSSDVYVMGAGLYSFFNNYAQQCVKGEDCQDNMISIEDSQVHMYGISTKASINMLTVDSKVVAKDQDNRNTYCAAIAKYDSGSAGGSGPGYGSGSSSSSLPASTASSTTSSTTSAHSSSVTTGSGLGPGSSAGSSSSDAADSPTRTTVSQSASTTGENGQPGGSVTTATGVSSVPAETTIFGGPSGGNSQPSSTLPTSVGAASSSSAGAGGDANSPVTVTVTETVTAAVTCQTP